MRLITDDRTQSETETIDRFYLFRDSDYPSSYVGYRLKVDSTRTPSDDSRNDDTGKVKDFRNFYKLFANARKHHNRQNRQNHENHQNQNLDSRNNQSVPKTLENEKETSFAPAFIGLIFVFFSFYGIYKFLTSFL